jgi:hypothetical protein
MGDNDPVLTYRQLIAEVRRLCVQRQTGWLFITTSDNHSVRFGLQNGAIVALTFRNKTGMEALAAIQQVLKGSPSFSNGLPDPKPQAGLPPTAELLALLQSAATDHPDEADTGPGPLDAHTPAASNLTDLIDSLAREISDPAKSASFKERVRERLASSVPGKNAR